MTSKTDAVEAVARVTAVPAILNLITEMTGLRLSLVAEVTDDRWLCCAVNDKLGFGLEVMGELDVNTTMCKEARAARAPVITSHASQDPAFCDHPAPKLYNFESYISVPIVLRDQRYFGNLCALDANPIDISPKIRVMFELFADMIGNQLELEASHAAALLDAKQTAELREQFIAMLGHDLRSPLGAITTGAYLLAEKGDPSIQPVVARMQRSAANITGMVDDLLDFARGRLGGGMAIEPKAVDLDEVVRHVVEEQRANGKAEIELAGDPLGTVRCDRGRVAQAISNLVSNARHHGAQGEPIRVTTRASVDDVEIVVANRGPMIPPERIPRIFEPYERGKDTAPRTGLGLGLFIVSEIARAHGGSVACDSAEAQTVFTLALPR